MDMRILRKIQKKVSERLEKSRARVILGLFEKSNMFKSACVAQAGW
jgi:hypothetical protein